MDGAIDIFYPSIAFNFGPMLTKLFSIDPTKYQDLLSTEKKMKYKELFQFYLLCKRKFTA